VILQEHFTGMQHLQDGIQASKVMELKGKNLTEYDIMRLANNPTKMANRWRARIRKSQETFDKLDPHQPDYSQKAKQLYKQKKMLQEWEKKSKLLKENNGNTR